ncbi:MAG: sensor histidine kinase [Bacteroidota bacterium]
MLNPITGKRIYFIAYLIIWMIISIVQMSIFIFIFDFQILPAVIDSLVSFVLHASIGIIIWFPVRFNPVSAKNLVNPLMAILVTGIFTVSAWTGLTYLALDNIFRGNEAYLDFLQRSVLSRVVTDFLLYAVLVLVYSLIVYSMNLKEKISDEANLRMLVREAEINMLKAQINPHFLFNALNSISLLTKKAPERAREMIIKLSEYLRYSLRFGHESTISFKEEIENMERYLEIEKIRFGNKLVYQKKIPSECKNFPIPNMILQPLLENAIKHGVYESTEPILIEIKAELKRNKLHISIENNFDPESIPRKGAGIGLKNIDSRLQLTYSRTDLLNYRKENGRFKVELYLPEESFKASKL